MCKWLAENGFKKVPVHFSRFYPTYKLEQLPPTPVDTLNQAAQIANDAGLLYVYTGNVPGNEISDTKCPGCGNTLIIREGYRIAANNIANGKCSKCGVAVDGVWN
jgi:pyruvate formate lyase activating enzyme